MNTPGPSELKQMQGLARRVMKQRPELVNAEATVGELAWVWAKDFDILNPYWRHRMWFVDGELAAWGWICLPYKVPRGDGTFRQAEETRLVWQVHPDQAELLDEILDWYDGLASQVDRLLTIQSADKRAQEIVAAHGYIFDEEDGADDGYWTQLNIRDLNELPEPELSEGFRFLTAREVSSTDAVKVHQKAWHPSSFTQTALDRVQQTPPYRADLHIFIAAPDGRLAATAIIWFDQASLTAEFEPVGTHPDFRRQGLGTALQLHGMQLAKEAGANHMLVACLGAPAHPAAKNMYFGVGFQKLSRDLPQIKIAR